MNIKINIRDCDCSPAVITRNEMSEVESKKKNMLYAPPTKDKKGTTANQSRNQRGLKSTVQKNSNSNRQLNQTQGSQQQPPSQTLYEAEKKLVQDLSAISRNQASTDMANHSQTVLQRQNEILESNQRTIQNLVQNSRVENSSRGNSEVQQAREVKKLFEESAEKIAAEVKQIKKMRDEILSAGEQFKRMLSEGGRGSQRQPEQIGEMNQNLKNLVEVSKNHIEGLENLEGLKDLQNFNIEVYTQSINTLKRQIVQYQKESENIERELKLRSAKLEKMEISPNFEGELLQPYEEYLKKKADSIDLHSIREKVFQKLGVFDYGKFQNDVSNITNEIRNEMNDFGIVCKQYKIDIPDIKIDKKELKQLDLKLPSILDEYKANKGINFEKENEQEEKGVEIKGGKGGNKGHTDRKKQLLDLPPARTKKPNSKQVSQEIQHLGPIVNINGVSKPMDMATNVKLTRTTDKNHRSVLETKQEQQRKEVQRNFKKKPSEEEDFEKYLDYRAKEELALIYEEKKKKLQDMERKLYDTCKEEPMYELELNLGLKNEIRNFNRREVDAKEGSGKKYISGGRDQEGKKQEVDEEDDYDDDFEDAADADEGQRNKKKSPKKQPENKQPGTEDLKAKLKNLFSNQQSQQQSQHLNHHFSQPHQQPQQQSHLQPQQQVQSIAEGFISMINNTLTQVNSQLSNSIQKKREQTLSREKIEGRGGSTGGLERRSPAKIAIPKLEEFRAPPVFNMEIVQQPRQEAPRRAEKKIVPKNYEHLRVNDGDDNDDLEVSAMSFDD